MLFTASVGHFHLWGLHLCWVGSCWGISGGVGGSRGACQGVGAGWLVVSSWPCGARGEEEEEDPEELCGPG